MKYLKAFIFLAVLSILFFFLNFFLHRGMTELLSQTLKESSALELSASGYNQTLRSTTVLNLFAISPIFTILVAEIYKKIVKKLRLKSFEYTYVYLFTFLVISSVVLPYVAGMFLSFLPRL